MSTPGPTGTVASFLAAAEQAEAERQAEQAEQGAQNSRVQAVTGPRDALRPAFAAARRAVGDALSRVIRLPFDADLAGHAGAVAAAVGQLAAVVQDHDDIPMIRRAAGLNLVALCYDDAAVPLDPVRGTPAGLADRLRRIDRPAVSAAFPAAHPARGAVELLLLAIDDAPGLVAGVRAVLAHPAGRAAVGWLPLLAALLDPEERLPYPADVYAPESTGEGGRRAWRRQVAETGRDGLRLAWLARGDDDGRLFDLFPALAPPAAGPDVRIADPTPGGPTDTGSEAGPADPLAEHLAAVEAMSRATNDLLGALEALGNDTAEAVGHTPTEAAVTRSGCAAGSPAPDARPAVKAKPRTSADAVACILKALKNAGKPLQRKELASASGYTSDTVGQYASSMVADGLLRSTPDGYTPV